MVRGVRHPRLVRSIALVAALTTMAGACSSTTTRASSTSADTESSTTTFAGPPTGTLPPLVAPPRSYKPVFSGEAAAVEKAFRDRLTAFERNDIDAVIALSSKPAPSLREDATTFAATFEVRLYRINAIDVKGNGATIDYEDAIVGRHLLSKVTTLLGQRDVWTKDDGNWKWVSDVSSAPGIPQDLKSVTLTLPDAAPIEVPTPVPTTDFAFLLKNTGKVPKGVFILGIPAGADVATVVADVKKVGVQRDNGASAPMPDGVLEMGATPDVPAGQDGTMVFNDRLPAGRYLLINTTPGTDGQRSMILPGEYADFTVK